MVFLFPIDPSLMSSQLRPVLERQQGRCPAQRLRRPRLCEYFYAPISLTPLDRISACGLSRAPQGFGAGSSQCVHHSCPLHRREIRFRHLLFTRRTQTLWKYVAILTSTFTTSHSSLTCCRMYSGTYYTTVSSAPSAMTTSS